jgi:hypothetical protein
LRRVTEDDDLDSHRAENGAVMIERGVSMAFTKVIVEVSRRAMTKLSTRAMRVLMACGVAVGSPRRSG